MRLRCTVPAALLLAALGGAQTPNTQAPEPPSKLPIDVPRDATVNFEADASGKDLVPVIKQLMGAGFTDPSNPHPEPLVLKTSLGNVELKPDDIAALLRPIRELHVVSYVSPKGEEPLPRYEKLFLAEGLERVADTKGEGFLLMRRRGDSGRYAFVLHQKDIVTVVRTDGMPNLGALGPVIFRAMANAAQHAVHKSAAVDR